MFAVQEWSLFFDDEASRAEKDRPKHKPRTVKKVQGRPVGLTFYTQHFNTTLVSQQPANLSSMQLPSQVQPTPINNVGVHNSNTHQLFDLGSIGKRPSQRVTSPVN